MTSSSASRPICAASRRACVPRSFRGQTCPFPRSPSGRWPGLTATATVPEGFGFTVYFVAGAAFQEGASRGTSVAGEDRALISVDERLTRLSPLA